MDLLATVVEQKEKLADRYQGMKQQYQKMIKLSKDINQDDSDSEEN